jgi:hypothetical protein
MYIRISINGSGYFRAGHKSLGILDADLPRLRSYARNGSLLRPEPGDIGMQWVAKELERAAQDLCNMEPQGNC